LCQRGRLAASAGATLTVLQTYAGPAGWFLGAQHTDCQEASTDSRFT